MKSAPRASSTLVPGRSNRHVAGALVVTPTSSIVCS
jgi:hypothetical protein